MNPIRDILTRTAWWAPCGVLLLHKIVMWCGLRGKSDWLLHLTGGLAITLFIWTLIPLLGSRLGTLSPFWRLLTAFSGGCTAALVWELSEFASDEILGTDIQHSLRETMLDLTYGFAGALAVLVLLCSFRVKRHKTNEAQPADAANGSGRHLVPPSAIR